MALINENGNYIRITNPQMGEFRNVIILKVYRDESVRVKELNGEDITFDNIISEAISFPSDTPILTDSPISEDTPIGEVILELCYEYLKTLDEFKKCVDA
jgi:hypothetical protein